MGRFQVDILCDGLETEQLHSSTDRVNISNLAENAQLDGVLLRGLASRQVWPSQFSLNIGSARNFVQKEVAALPKRGNVTSPLNTLWCSYSIRMRGYQWFPSKCDTRAPV